MSSVLLLPPPPSLPSHTLKQTQIKIENSNFFPVRVNALNVTLSSLLTRVGLTSYPPFSVSMRATKAVSEDRVQSKNVAVALPLMEYGYIPGQLMCSFCSWSIPIMACVTCNYLFSTHTNSQ